MNPDPTLLVDESVEPAEPLAELARNPFGEHGAAPLDSDNGSLLVLVGFIAAFIALGALQSWWIPGIILGLLFMLFMHEFGHFATARASGMLVTEFFLGFGPKIWSFNKGETEYGIKAIPAGAYVRIIGMTNLDEIDPALEHRTYRHQSYWKRMVVICAGSTMHFLMAIVSLIVLFGAYSYAGFNGPPWEVDRVVEGSSAAAIGVETGDRIVSFAGESFDTWDEFGDTVLATPVGEIVVEVERDGELLELIGVLGARSGDVVGSGFGIVMNEDSASQGWTVGTPRSDSNAADFGFVADDVILRAGDQPRPTQLTFAELLQESEGESLTVTVLRDGAEVPLNAVVELDRSAPFRGFLGVGAGYIDEPDPSWSESVDLAIDDFGIVARTNLVGIIDLVNPMTWFDGEGPTAATSSPGGGTNTPSPQPDEGSNRPVSVIGIGRLFAESESVDEALYLFMVVNIFIGMFNLFPLLPLDGGHAALGTFERVRQFVTRKADYRVDAGRLIPLTWAVVGLLMVVGVWTAFLDIFSWPA